MRTLEKLSNEIEKYRNEVLERRDNIMRTMGIPDNHELLSEENNQLNELSQLITYTRSGIDCEELNAECSERLYDLRFGIKNEKRRDR